MTWYLFFGVLIWLLVVLHVVSDTIRQLRTPRLAALFVHLVTAVGAIGLWPAVVAWMYWHLYAPPAEDAS